PQISAAHPAVASFQGASLCWEGIIDLVVVAAICAEDGALGGRLMCGDSKISPPAILGGAYCRGDCEQYGQADIAYAPPVHCLARRRRELKFFPARPRGCAVRAIA